MVERRLLRVVRGAVSSVGARPPQAEHLADAQDFSGPGARADGFADGRALGTVGDGHPHLDEFVGLERAIDLGNDAVGQTRLSDLHDRLECVSPGLEGAAFAVRQ